MTIHFEKLSEHVGAEVQGIDIRRAISDVDRQALSSALLEHGMLLIRNQMLGPQQLVDFGHQWGELKPHVQKKFHVPGYPVLVYNINVDREGMFDDGAARRGVHETTKENWHSDQSYDAVPSRATIVTAVELPQEGGSTVFKNTYLAYETMPAELKSRIDGKRGVFGYVAGRKHPSRGHLNATAAAADTVTHPIARTVPMTQRKCVYVNAICCSGVADMAPDDGAALLDDVYRWLDRPEYTYEHKWRLGDTIIWDNRGGTFHTGKLDYPLWQRRIMYRTTVAAQPEEYLQA
ncbi:MAG: taurine dioxygenase [Gammaproteobacteria bacterium]